MILPCEVAVKSVIPAVRALVANELLEKHGLDQEEVAEILGISQSAVSKYATKVRGHVIEVGDVDEIQPIVDQMTMLLMSGAHQRREFLVFFCQACAAVRRSGLMCQFCSKSDSSLRTVDCGFCLNK